MLNVGVEFLWAGGGREGALLTGHDQSGDGCSHQLKFAWGLKVSFGNSKLDLLGAAAARQPMAS